mgnify:FL=1
MCHNIYLCVFVNPATFSDFFVKFAQEIVFVERCFYVERRKSIFMGSHEDVTPPLIIQVTLDIIFSELVPQKHKK